MPILLLQSEKRQRILSTVENTLCAFIQFNSFCARYTKDAKLK